MNHYEQSGIIFLVENEIPMSTNLFCRAVELEYQNAMCWYCLGQSLLKLSQISQQEKSYSLGLCCLKKSYELDKNEYSKSILANFNNEDLEKLPIANLDMVSKIKLDINTEQLINGFGKIKNEDNKIQLAMHLGETRNPIFFDFLRHCVVNEQNPHIRFAALKRIAYLKQENLKAFFEEIIRSEEQNNLEPYFSMALASINEEWCKKYINLEFANINNEGNKSFTEFEIATSLKNDEVRAVITLGLIKYDKQEIEKLFKNRNQKVLAFYLANGMNDEGIDFLFKNNILDNQGNILAIGWRHIEQFLQTDFNAKNDEQKLEPKNETNVTIKSKKKWWRIWE